MQTHGMERNEHFLENGSARFGSSSYTNSAQFRYVRSHWYDSFSSELACFSVFGMLFGLNSASCSAVRRFTSRFSSDSVFGFFCFGIPLFLPTFVEEEIRWQKNYRWYGGQEIFGLFSSISLVYIFIPLWINFTMKTQNLHAEGNPSMCL